MVKVLQVGEFVDRMKGASLLDIRTPSEFQEGHLPGAVNFPLFTDEERAIVGTIYKQQGKEPAVLKGLEIVGPKLKKFVVQASGMEGPLFLYCWRGGMRSSSMAWLLSTAGRKVYLLEGGYKAYRTHYRGIIEQGLNLVMLAGPTGSGKTEILQAMKRLGHQVLDLEGLANHKGSSFGALGQLPQPTTEQFHNLIFEAISGFDTSRPIWLEGESQNIGKVFIPRELFAQMNCCNTIRIDPPFESRVKRLLRDYACFEKTLLLQSIERISKRLGGADTQAAIEALEKDDYRKVTEITLNYYDKTYEFSMGRRETKMIPFAPLTDDPLTIAEEISNFAAEQFGLSDSITTDTKQ